jgi:hypothetical protein
LLKLKPDTSKSSSTQSKTLLNTLYLNDTEVELVSSSTEPSLFFEYPVNLYVVVVVGFKFEKVYVSWSSLTLGVSLTSPPSNLYLLPS